MTFDPVWLFVSLIPSGIGLVLFVYGRKQQRWPQLAAGLAGSLTTEDTEDTEADIGRRSRRMRRRVDCSRTVSVFVRLPCAFVPFVVSCIRRVTISL